MEYILFDETFQIKGINMPKSKVGYKKMCKLCDAAETLFDNKGFYNTSIADICAHANTAIGTFYIYFQDKTSVYEYLVKNYYAVIKKHLKNSIAKCKTRYEMEKEGLKEFIRFGYAHPQCYKIIWGSSHINPVLFEDYYIRFAKSYVAALAQYGDELNEMDYSTTAWFLMGVANFVCLKIIIDRKKLTKKKLDDLVNEVMKLLSCGMFRRTNV